MNQPRPPQFWMASDIDPTDRQSFKQFGQCEAGQEFLYRLYDADHQLLYVGITWNPFVRWTAHATSKPWWNDVAHVEVWRCTDADARFWETRCIKEQHPLRNIHQSVRSAV